MQIIPSGGSTHLFYALNQPGLNIQEQSPSTATAHQGCVLLKRWPGRVLVMLYSTLRT